MPGSSDRWLGDRWVIEVFIYEYPLSTYYDLCAIVLWGKGSDSEGMNFVICQFCLFCDLQWLLPFGTVTWSN